MKRPDTIIIEGRAYSWRVLLELRRAQLSEWQAAQPRQPALFELRDDRRPQAERSASGRYLEPTLMAFLQDGRE
jgi:hypothetical protein